MLIKTRGFQECACEPSTPSNPQVKTCGLLGVKRYK